MSIKQKSINQQDIKYIVKNYKLFINNICITITVSTYLRMGVYKSQTFVFSPPPLAISSWSNEGKERGKNHLVNIQESVLSNRVRRLGSSIFSYWSERIITPGQLMPSATGHRRSLIAG